MRKFIVALKTGGLMEQPDIEYTDFQLIDALAPDIARCDYNKINGCEYYYGVVICKLIGGLIFINNGILLQVDMKGVLKLLHEVGYSQQIIKIYAIDKSIYDLNIKYIVGELFEGEYNDYYIDNRIIEAKSEDDAKDLYCKQFESSYKENIRILGYIICEIPFIKRSYCEYLDFSNFPCSIDGAEFID